MLLGRGNPIAQNGTLFTINNQLFYYMNGQAIAVESIATVLYDTHTNRVANYPPGGYVKGTLFYETDRQVLYVDSGTAWLYATGVMENTIVSRPSDLGTSDPGFLFMATDWDVLYRWNGSAWIYFSGIYSDITANRPGTLGANDTNFLFIDTSLKILERWTGSAWVTIGSVNTNLVLAFNIQSGNYTVLSTDFQVVSANSGAANFTLPDATTVPGQVFALANSTTSTGLLTLIPPGQTIGGAVNQFLTPGSSIIIASVGTTNWTILSVAALGPWEPFSPGSITNLNSIVTDCAYQPLAGKSSMFRISIQGSAISNATPSTFIVPWTAKSNNIGWGGIEILVTASSMTPCAFTVSGSTMSTQFGSVTAGATIRYEMIGIVETT